MSIDHKASPQATRLRWFDAVIAVSLIIVTTVLLGLTSDIGFTRDESFYFRYAEVYQDWFSQIGNDEKEESAFARKPVVHAWQQNFEHPPLMKVLFGWSWRAFALKKRPVRRFQKTTAGMVTARVQNSGPADGFQKGDKVRILGPLLVNSPASDDSRLIAEGEIIEREDGWSTVRLDDADLSELTSSCRAPPPGPDPDAPHPWMNGCQAKTTGALHVMNEANALRLPAWVFAGILLALLFLFGTELFGRWAGLFAVATFLFIPRHFFHAHLCAFDVPVVTMVVATVYAYWRSLRSTRWAILAGVVWGFALLTKHNAFFIPVPLVMAWLLTDPPRIVPSAETPESTSKWHRWTWPLAVAAATLSAWLIVSKTAGVVIALSGGLIWMTATRRRFRIPDMPKAFLWMPPIGLVVFFSLWPRLWYDPARSFFQYVAFHWEHVHYLQQHFGEILVVPPFSVAFPFTMTALTVPIPLLLTFALGCIALFLIERRQVDRHLRWLLAANLLFPILLIALPSTPIFGGIKHWLPSMAFFALIAGYGFNWVRRLALEHLKMRPLLRVATAGILAVLVLSSSVVDSVQYRRFGSAYYNALAGGVRGAAEHKMQRQFWGYAGAYGLDHINKNARRGALVAFHNTTHQAHTFYKRLGMLREDIRWEREPRVPGRTTASSITRAIRNRTKGRTNPCQRGTQYYLYHHQESFAQDEISAWLKLGSWEPEQVITVDGVPMLSIYGCR